MNPDEVPSGGGSGNFFDTSKYTRIDGVFTVASDGLVLTYDKNAPAFKIGDIMVFECNEDSIGTVYGVVTHIDVNNEIVVSALIDGKYDRLQFRYQSTDSVYKYKDFTSSLVKPLTSSTGLFITGDAYFNATFFNYFIDTVNNFIAALSSHHNNA